MKEIKWVDKGCGVCDEEEPARLRALPKLGKRTLRKAYNPQSIQSMQEIACIIKWVMV